MLREYDADYGVALKDEAFVHWLEAGARQKAENVVKVCGGIQVTSVIEIGFKRFLNRDCFLEILENHVDPISKEAE
jgi:hypothetical protein